MINKSSLLYWFPIIKVLPIPMPETKWVEIPESILCSMLDMSTQKPSNPLEAYWEAIKQATKEIGFPLFLRTDLSSAKHQWGDTCFVSEEKALFANIWRVVEFNFVADLSPSALVFREFIPMKSLFTAWDGLPIGAERRYFIRDGKVECHHPYWAEGAIEKAWLKTPGWRELLAKANTETDEEISLLSGYAKLVAEVLPGYWSADFSLARDGRWILIDLAEGELSWHPNHFGAGEGNLKLLLAPGGCARWQLPEWVSYLLFAQPAP